MTGSQLAVQGIRSAAYIVLAWFLAPEDFGLMALALVGTQFLDVFKDAGTGSAIIQKPRLTDSLLSSIFYLNLGIGAVLGGGLALLGPWIARLYANPEVAPLLQALALTVLVSSLAIVQQGLLRRELRFNRLTIVNVATAVTNAGISIGLAVAGFGVWSLVVGTLASGAVSAVLSWTFSPWRPRLLFRIDDLRDVASFSLNLTGFNLLGFALQNVDKIVIGRFLGARALGLYALADRVLMYPIRSITQVLREVLFPAFSRMQEDHPAFGRAFVRACAGIALITFPAMVGITLVAEPMVQVFLGERWLPAAPLIAILAPAGALQSVNLVAGLIYRAKGRTDWLLRWGIVSGLLIIASFIVGVRWGLTGIAWSYATMIALQTIPSFSIPFRLIDLRLTALARAIVPFVVGTSLMAVAVLLVQGGLQAAGDPPPVVQLSASVATGAVVYGCYILVLRPPALRDLLHLVGVSRRLRRRPTHPLGSAAPRAS